MACLYGIGDALPTACPECGHRFVFFDALYNPDSVDDKAACWGVCDACLASTQMFIDQRALLESLNEGSLTWTPPIAHTP